MITYSRNTPITLFANYTDSNGFPINYLSGTTLDVYHFNSSGIKTFDVISGTMAVDIDAPNRFNYFYTISGNAYPTNYIVEYSALGSSGNIQLIDQFNVTMGFSPGFPLNSNITLVANYTDNNHAPIFSGISGNTVSLYHFDASGTKIFDVASGTMAVDDDDINRFYYPYFISGNSALTNYIVEYDAIYSGNSIQLTDTFNVASTVVGSAMATGAIIDLSGSGVDGALVNVSIFPSSAPIQTALTNDGFYSLVLDPGDYVLSISASGYVDTNIFRTVPPSMPTVNFGATTLYGFNVGMFQISDTYVHLADDDETQIPISGLRVSLFEKGVRALNVSKAISIGYTNSSGTFTLNANQGKYVLLVEGTQTDNAVYQTAYDIDVDPIFKSASAIGFRYLGTSQYNFLI